jgi:uncharacterized C2H2 Zn-finger protein
MIVPHHGRVQIATMGVDGKNLRRAVRCNHLHRRSKAYTTTTTTTARLAFLARQKVRGHRSGMCRRLKRSSDPPDKSRARVQQQRGGDKIDRL